MGRRYEEVGDLCKELLNEKDSIQGVRPPCSSALLSDSLLPLLALLDRYRCLRGLQRKQKRRNVPERKRALRKRGKARTEKRPARRKEKKSGGKK